MTARRIDFHGKLDGRTELGDGSVRFNARLTRIGVFDYGSHRELRREEDVFDQAALDSFKGLAVTVGHVAWLDASNWREHAIGHVGDDVRRDGDYVAATLIVKDKKAIEKIDAKQLVEISMGYSVDLDETPGRTDAGEDYDAIQKNIRGNHAALGPKDWGRMGRDVKLLDGTAYKDATPRYPEGTRVRSLVDHMPGMKGAVGVVRIAREGTPPYYGVQFDGEREVHKWLAEDEVEKAAGEPAAEGKGMAMGDSRAAYAPGMSGQNGQRFDAPTDKDLTDARSDAAAARADADTLRKERDTARAERDDAKKRADTLEAERDAAKRDADKAKKDLDDAKKVEDARVDARIALVDSARSILGKDFDHKGKSDREIRVAVLAKVDSKIDFTGKSDDYVAAAFDLATKKVDGERAALGGVNQIASTPAAQKSKIDEAYERAEEEARKAHEAGPPAGAMVRK